jgi:hypothetical protein
MAPAVRPVVRWMLLSALLFLATGIVDGVYPGGRNWPPSPWGGAPWIAYAFGAVELLLAILVAKGRDWAFFAAIGISAFFALERPLGPLMVQYTSVEGYALHFMTGVAQLLTMFAAMRVFRTLHQYLEPVAH